MTDEQHDRTGVADRDRWRRWRELLSGAEVVDALCALYDERGGAMYDESVSQTAHAVQTAMLAERDGASPALVVASLLHDLAHLLERDPADGAAQPDRDLRHEVVAARLLANWFGPEVTAPIRHHVAAKRYLCAIDPEYLRALSPASVHSLALQGGPMSPGEAGAFLGVDGAAEAVRLRRWDDSAKNPELATPAFADHRELLLSVVRIER